MLSQKRALIFAMVIAMCALAAACDDSGSSTYGDGAASAKNGGAAVQLAQADQDFAIKASMAGRHEVALGKLVADRASDSEVKAFGNRMVKDHSSAGEDLAKITSKLGVSVPAEDDAAFKEAYARLSNLKGKEFDRAYISEMVAGHTKVASEVDSYAKGGGNADLKGWATKAAPVVHDHLQMAQGIDARINKAM